MKTIFQVALCLCLVALWLQGCSSGSPTVVTLTPQTSTVFSTQTVSLTATDTRGSADLTWSVGNPTGAPPANVDSSGNFVAPTVTQNTTYMVTVTSMKDAKATASATVTVMASGQVATTAHPQVATYSLTPPAGTTAYVQFGTDTSYALKTWSQPAPTTGGALSLFVAGMRANTLYHMRAVVVNSDGSTANDVDHTFTTSTIPAVNIPRLTATTTAGATPQPGVEMLDLLNNYGLPPVDLAVVDLAGNLVWSYPAQGTTSDLLQGVHLLPNGHFLMDISPASNAGIGVPAPVPGTIDVIREIDLAGTTIQEVTMDQINAALPAAGFNFTIFTTHHDVIALPNGHWVVLGSILQPCVGLATCSTNPNLLGDVIIDLAPQSGGGFLPVWAWNTFDHLDTSRAPMGYPDWTHCNALLYSPDDGHLLLSSRAQSWIIKIDYANGQGAGDILWKLGNQGDFALQNGTDPTDWFTSQHGPAFATTNTSGQFQLSVMDNGNERSFPGGGNCASSGLSPCPYSTGMLFQIDETAKTASIVDKYAPGEYSLWGGNAELLTNGNLESDFNAGSPLAYSDIFETTPGASPQVVWHLQTLTVNAYRGFRMGSLYPGVQW
jgi:arylsulfate sulfotransferase